MAYSRTKTCPLLAACLNISREINSSRFSDKLLERRSGLNITQQFMGDLDCYPLENIRELAILCVLRCTRAQFRPGQDGLAGPHIKEGSMANYDPQRLCPLCRGHGPHHKRCPV